MSWSKHGLSEAHEEIIRELMSDILTKAVFSMEQMLKIRVKSELLSFGPNFSSRIPEFDNLGRFKVHLVKVQFRGELQGAIYFIINSHEVDLINQVCLPAGMSPEGRVENKMMQHGFMSEIENVISAQALQQISEYLGVQVMGGVPEINIIPGKEVNKFLVNENLSLETAFHAVSILNGVAVNIAPYFIWMMDQTFIDILRLNS